MIVFLRSVLRESLGYPKNCFNQPFIMSTNTICFGKEIRKLILIKDLAYN